MYSQQSERPAGHGRLLAALAFFGAALTACASDPFVDLRGGEDAAAILPVAQSRHGHMMVSVSIDGSLPGPFIIDTGSTASVIFDDFRRRYDLTLSPEPPVEVRGLTGRDRRPLTRAGSVQIGPLSYDDFNFVALPPQARIAIAPNARNRALRTPRDQAHGLIGLDVLSSFVMAYDADGERLVLIEPQTFTPPDMTEWLTIELTGDPFASGETGLYFAQAAIDGRYVPALIDTGSIATLLNWVDIDDENILSARRRLREELQDAIGNTEPAVSARFSYVVLGRVDFGERDVMVLDYDSGNLTQSAGRALMVAGTDMFNDRDVIFDFPGNRLFIRALPGDAIRDDDGRPGAATRVIRRD